MKISRNMKIAVGLGILWLLYRRSFNNKLMSKVEDFSVASRLNQSTNVDLTGWGN